jgi:hypothetical protein
MQLPHGSDSSHLAYLRALGPLAHDGCGALISDALRLNEGQILCGGGSCAGSHWRTCEEHLSLNHTARRMAPPLPLTRCHRRASWTFE